MASRKKYGRPKGSHNESDLPEGLEEEIQEESSSDWHFLFTTSTRLHFLKAFINWRKNSAKSPDKIPIDGLKECKTPDGKILFYYDFYGCHQYSKVLLTRLVSVPIGKLERDINRYIRMIANDNRVVGRILSKSASRLENWKDLRISHKALR